MNGNLKKDAFNSIVKSMESASDVDKKKVAIFFTVIGSHLYKLLLWNLTFPISLKRNHV